MKDLGYNTHLVGKWHVGCYKEALFPTNRGFDTFFGYSYGNLGYFDGLHATGVSIYSGAVFICYLLGSTQQIKIKSLIMHRSHYEELCTIHVYMFQKLNRKPL